VKTRTWGVSETGLRDWEGGRVESNEEKSDRGGESGGCGGQRIAFVS
jgi:hypothetical protein